MQNLCHAFGLLVHTEVAIPGALPAAPVLDAAPRPDLSILTGPAELSEVHRSSGPYRTGPEGLLYEKRGLARYLCSPAGDVMQVQALPGAAGDEVSAFLIATALPAALWLRGEMMLHAAAAVFPGAQQAVALLGVSGSGKSALLRSIVEAGGEVVAEDSLCIRSEGSGFSASGLPGSLQLRLSPGPLSAVRTPQEVPPAQTRQSANLSALVLLEPQESGWVDSAASHIPVQCRPLSAVATLLRHRHRPKVPDLLNASNHLLPRWAAISRALPVYSWKFRRGALHSSDGVEPWRALAAVDRNDVEGLF